MDLKELEHKTVNDLREMAKEYEDIEGAAGMKKNELLDVLCQKLGIDRSTHVPEGIGRRKLKTEVGELKKKRDAALESHDSAALAQARHAIRSNKRKLRRTIQRAIRREKGQPKKAAEA